LFFVNFQTFAKLQKQFRIFLLSPDYKIVAKSLNTETELGINKAGSDNVYVKTKACFAEVDYKTCRNGSVLKPLKHPSGFRKPDGFG